MDAPNTASGSSRGRSAALAANVPTRGPARDEQLTIPSKAPIAAAPPENFTPIAPQTTPPQGPRTNAQDPRPTSGGQGRSRSSFSAPQGQDPKDKKPVIKRTTEQQLLLRSARNAVALSQIDEAADLFESYLVLLPTDIEVRTEYAGLLVQKGRLDEARELYINTLEELPLSNEIRHRLVDVLIISGEYATAAIHLEEIVRLNPDDLSAAAMLCRAYSWVKDLEKAKSVYDRYLRKLDPQSPRDQALIAPALLDMQKPREALPHLLSLQAKSPNELVWSTSLVYCYELLGEEARASRTVDAIQTLEPTVTEPRVQLVVFLIF